MAFSQEMVEQIGAWCFSSPELASEREKAWSLFFGEGDPRPAKYWIGGDDRIGRERRFLGWFMFDCALRDGEKPAEAAVKRLYSGSVQAEALKAVSGARYLFAVARRIDGRSVYLDLEGDSFEVRSSMWAANLRQYQAVVAHIVPVRHGYWLPAPGWLVWPVSIGPGMRANLKELQTDPISMERNLQGRFDREERPEPPRPADDTLEAAVARMSAWAREKGQPKLDMPADRWRVFVQRHIGDRDVTAFAKEVLGRQGGLASEEELQELLALSNNIWNNTPQPDRGGMSPRQLVELHSKSRKPMPQKRVNPRP